MLAGVEFDMTIIVEPCSNVTTGMDGMDNCKVTSGDAKQLVRCGELKAVTNGKFMRDFAEATDAGQINEPGRALFVVI